MPFFGSIGGFFSAPASGETDPFYTLWGSHWFTKITGDATYTAFTVTGDTDPGFSAGNMTTDINYSVLATNDDPTRTLYVPGAWDDRDSGTTEQGTLHVPASFVLEDAVVGTTPNNPTIILNTDEGTATYLNACARPSSTGNIWGYQSTPSRTHGGSGLIGGEIKQAELDAGVIPHAIAINVYGSKYLSNLDGGFVSPATKADTGFDDSGSGNYYGGDVVALKMGSHVAIPSDVSAASLSVTSDAALVVYQALVTYGAYISDNTAWDALAFNTDTDATTTLSSLSTEMLALFQAMELIS